MKLRRDIAVTPQRAGAEAWAEIVKLITGPGSQAVDQLTAAASVMATLLTEEDYADHPLTLKGKCMRLVIYGVYGADAISLEDPDPLQQNPTEGEWTLFVPCPEEDLDWTRDALAKRAPRIQVHGLDETPAELAEEKADATQGFAIDWGAVS
ncbi:hypothetical protein [Phenylobacterium soli]|uniref:Uncharacterized protein n=1 Tax=Phenylobacterium soli TaxID=2170551 RepID=A0A328AKI4_9CAUL|nr:hypothetical protein [Phenylobacterium soli]RAK54905.1 hypothetical protein DJ017_10380 [Phenylobacterium soli]